MQKIIDPRHRAEHVTSYFLLTLTSKKKQTKREGIFNINPCFFNFLFKSFFIFFLKIISIS